MRCARVLVVLIALCLAVTYANHKSSTPPTSTIISAHDSGPCRGRNIECPKGYRLSSRSCTCRRVRAGNAKQFETTVAVNYGEKTTHPTTHAPLSTVFFAPLFDQCQGRNTQCPVGYGLDERCKCRRVLG